MWHILLFYLNKNESEALWEKTSIEHDSSLTGITRNDGGKTNIYLPVCMLGGFVTVLLAKYFLNHSTDFIERFQT